MSKKLMNKTSIITIVISMIVGIIISVSREDIIRWLTVLSFFFMSFISTSLDKGICKYVINRGDKSKNLFKKSYILCRYINYVDYISCKYSIYIRGVHR